MKNVLNEIAELASTLSTPSMFTAIPGFMIVSGEVPWDLVSSVYEPIVGFVVQGSKTLSINGRVVEMKGPCYFVISSESPAVGKINPPKDGINYLSIGFLLKQSSILELLKEIPENLFSENSIMEFTTSEMTPDLAEVWLRFLKLLKTPEYIPILAPVYERELLFKILLGPQGFWLRQFCQLHGKDPSVYHAIQWIRKYHAESINIKSLAEKAGMGVTTFHRQFKKITGLSPIQYQKQLRLLEAKKLVCHSGYSAAEAAFEVGYESASQFNREYSKFFGVPPARDAQLTKKNQETT